MKNFSFPLQDNTHQGESPFHHGLLSLINKSESLRRPERNEHLAHLEIAVLAIVFIMASLGNFCLILILWRKRKKLPRMCISMLHLSLADLVAAFFQILPQLIWDITDVFIGPDVLCKAIKYLQLVGMFASTYMIVVMTIDRCQAICNPGVTFQKEMSLWNASVGISWLVALIFSLPQVFVFSKAEIAPGVFECWAEFIQPWGPRAYVTWIFVAIFFIPMLILMICQGKICRIIQRNRNAEKHSKLEIRRQKQIVPSQASSINSISKAMIKTVKMTAVTIVAYILCWAPFFTVQMWSVWHPSTVTEGGIFTIIMLLGNLNSCANPWIYMYFCGHIPFCKKMQPEKISVREQSVVTGSINLGEKGPEDNATSV
ncbi:mesotocin receptor-like [Dromiciops gliroides]|uniref:mesotocin receptor-like n=1 Tax=Dromiciops gliroides TaxID=33562 RepID=UPI001CC819D2|nr:mesotocin receptor-like [Dromiciops gliroides]